MIDKIFFDTNILIDLILQREGYKDVLEIMDFVGQDPFKRIYVSYLSMADLAYVMRKNGNDYVKDILKHLMKWCNVLPSSDMQILKAMKNSSPDFEDSLQIACAEYHSCDLILTRNTNHFRNHTDIPVLTPQDFTSHSGNSLGR